MGSDFGTALILGASRHIDTAATAKSACRRVHNAAFRAFQWQCRATLSAEASGPRILRFAANALHRAPRETSEGDVVRLPSAVRAIGFTPTFWLLRHSTSIGIFHQDAGEKPRLTHLSDEFAGRERGLERPLVGERATDRASVAYMRERPESSRTFFSSISGEGEARRCFIVGNRVMPPARALASAFSSSASAPEKRVGR